jgi:transposase
MPVRISVGIDVAKEVHWAAAVGEAGDVLLDRRVENTAESIAALIAELQALDGQRTIGVDILGGVAALLVALLLAAGERLVHVPGIAVNRARQGHVGGERKSDPKDARVIADQVRVRRDLRPIAPEPDAVAELRLLAGHRGDITVEQTRRLTRLRTLLLTIHPGLERTLDVTTKGALWLLTRYVAAAEIRAAGRKRLLRHMRACPNLAAPERLVDAARAAAEAHPVIALRGERLTADLVRELARDALAARTRLRALDRQLGTLLDRHPDAALIRSLPGMGAVLAAELIGEVGDFTRFRSADALAAAAGLAPVLRQSGKSRALRRPLWGNKALKRVFYQSRRSARSATRSAEPSTTASAPKGNATTKPSSRSRGAASTSSGRCSTSAPPSTHTTGKPLDARITQRPHSAAPRPRRAGGGSSPARPGSRRSAAA